MSLIVSNPYPTLPLADHVVQRLAEQGIPAEAINVRNDLPAIGLNLGAGVPIEAMEAVLTEHENEASVDGEPGGFVVEVDTGDRTDLDAIVRELFAK